MKAYGTLAPGASARQWLGQSLAFAAAWWHQIALSSGTIWMMTMYGQSHDILPFPVAVALALGFEGILIRGLADASVVRRSLWATALIWCTGLTAITWGCLYIIGLPSVGIIPQDDLGPVWGVITAAAHVLPIAFTTICSALLHRAKRRERAEDEQAIIDQRTAIDLDYQAKLKEIELASARKRAEDENALWRAQQRALLQRNVAAQHGESTVAALPAASGRGNATVQREALRNAVQQAWQQNPNFNQSAIAAEFGVHRSTINRIVKELENPNA